MSRNNLLIIFFSLFSLSLLSQNNYPKSYFRPPLDIPLYLSGSFGELRPGHFHSGIDLKTQGVTGKEVLAVAEGYVSRIKISLGGYGKALYITHPNGYVSVYGHLLSFNDTLEKLVKKTQYERESYLIEIFPKRGHYPVKKGEVIAFSGNSGSSGGPHLHFEIREEKSQYPVNPLLFKSIKIADRTYPRILQLSLYPVDDTTLINGKHDTTVYMVTGSGKNCSLKGKPQIIIHGRASLGIDTYDLTNKLQNKNGVYKIEVFIDTTRIFGLKMDKISFYTTRYINSLIDYNYYQKKGKRLVRTQIDTNNRLFNYYGVKNRGIFSFNDSLFHKVRIRVYDTYGNQSILAFNLRGNSKPLKSAFKKKLLHKPAGLFENFRRSFFVIGKNYRADFPARTFYRSFYLNHKTEPRLKGTYSSLIVLGNRFVPVQKLFTLKIKPDTVENRLKSKLFVAYLPAKKVVDFVYTGSSFVNDSLVTRVRDLGNYTVMIDTIPPVIRQLNFLKTRLTAKQKTLKLKIEDKESGIKSYRATLNGKWLLMEYDQKDKLLTYFIDKHLPKGKSTFRLEVIDNVGNKTEFETQLIR